MYSGDPEILVADYQERTIQGELADGTPVTLVRAQGGSRSLGFLRDPSEAKQEFRAMYVLNGAFVTPEQLYRAVRFQVAGLYWQADDEDEAQTAEGGLLRIDHDDEGAQWIEFTCSEPMTFGDIDSGVIGAVLTLTKLATASDAADVEVEVQLEAGGPWRAIHRGREVLGDNGYPLLAPRHLTAEKFAAWISFRRHTEGLDAAVVDDLGGVAVQAQVLTLCSVAEGLHRRLFASGGKRVKALSDSKIAKIRRSVRAAVLAEMGGSNFAEEDRDELRRAITDAFAHINEQTFRSRMSDLILDAQRTIPSLGSGFADWPDALSTARNRLAHQPSAPDSTEEKQFMDLLIALSYSIPWVLRTNLLNKAGFDTPTLREAYSDSSRYGYHLANTRMLLAGGPWAVEVNH